MKPIIAGINDAGIDEGFATRSTLDAEMTAYLLK